MCCCPAVTDEVSDAGDERAKGEVDIANDVERKAIVSEDDREKRKVREELEEVYVAPMSESRRGNSSNLETHL